MIHVARTSSILLLCVVFLCAIACGGGSGTDLAEKEIAVIVAHKWWKVPPTREKVEEMAAFLAGTNSGHAVYIDESGRMAPSKYSGRFAAKNPTEVAQIQSACV